MKFIMRGTCLIIFMFLHGLSSVYCQQGERADSRILFRGVVIAASSQERLPGSQIYINRRSAGISRNDGTFSFFAFKNDTIVFTMLGFSPARMVVSDTLTGKEFITGIFLQSDTLDIGEVIILPRITNLKAEIMNSMMETNAQMANARSNISIASYQGRTGQGTMGDPSINYEILRQKQKTEAYEKGGIPSDKIIGLSPLMLIPAAYLLLNGLPEVPEAPEPRISQKDLDELNSLFLKKLK
jgi:hypothetical protein